MRIVIVICQKLNGHHRTAISAKNVVIENTEKAKSPFLADVPSVIMTKAQQQAQCLIN